MSQITSFGGGGGGGSITQIDGNTGFATGPVMDLITANEQTLLFVGNNLTIMTLRTTDTDGNSSYGAAAMLNLAAGAERNLALGAAALGNLLTGTDNVVIGAGAAVAYNGAESNNIVIGSLNTNASYVGDNNTIRIGEPALQLNCYIAGIDGVNVGSVAEVVTMGTAATAGKLGTAVITAGTGISVTPGANTITIAATGMGAFTWSVIAADQTAAVNNGYFCNKAGTLALLLPAASAVGDTIEVANENTALGVQFTQAAGQQILIGNTNTTLGATGTLTSSAVGDTLRIVCKVANTIWRVTSGWGNWSPV